MNEHLYITGVIATYILYCYFWRVFLLNAPTFIVCPIPPFLVYVKQLPTTASVGDLLVWHKFPATSWWSALPPLPNQLGSFPSPGRETESCDAGRKDGGASIHNAPGIGATHDPPDGRRCCCGWSPGFRKVVTPLISTSGGLRT